VTMGIYRKPYPIPAPATVPSHMANMVLPPPKRDLNAVPALRIVEADRPAQDGAVISAGPVITDPAAAMPPPTTNPLLAMFPSMRQDVQIPDFRMPAPGATASPHSTSPNRPGLSPHAPGAPGRLATSNAKPNGTFVPLLLGRL
jgi:hypothetical protein